MSDLILPDGTVIYDSTDSDVYALLDTTQNDWERGSGDAMVSFANQKTKVNLIIIKSSDNRYYLEYIDKSEKIYDPNVSIREAQNSGKLVSVIVGGEEHVLPDVCFLERVDAHTAIHQFMLSGELSNKLTWKRRSEIAWPLVEDDEDDN